MGRFVILLFVLLVKQATAQIRANRIISPKSNNNPITIGEFEDIIKYYRYYKQDSAIFFANRGISFARQKGDSNGVALMLVQLGMIDDNAGEFDSSRQKYSHAMEMFKTTGYKRGIASTLIRSGVVDLRNGKYDKAIENFLSALKISEQVGDNFGAMEANYSISWAWLDQKNYDKALYYLKIAEDLNKNLPFSNISLNIMNHFGVILRETGAYAKAAVYLETGILQSNRNEYQGLNITLINNLASVYAKQGQIDKAISLQEEALSRARKIGNYLRELQTLLGLSKTYAKNNKEKAISYILEAINLAREKRVPKQEMRYLKIAADLYKADGKYREALNMKEREHDLADSFFSQNTVQNIESLKAEYELEKSNAKIKELDLQNKKRQLELTNSAILKNVFLAGTVLLLIILGLLFNQYRIKQKNNREVSLKNRSLERLLIEKEWLLKEVHHRVKNNLHTIVSLLETQSAYLKDDALQAIQNSQHRVHAMSLIHQKLYQVENTTNINMAVYLPELINYLTESYDTGHRIKFQSEIENIKLDISQAIPVGLILNEAITNSIKYAFPDRDDGVILIQMTRSGHKNIFLSIADNGIGLPAEWQTIQKSSIGLKLMMGLTDDLRGKFSVSSGNGTTIMIEFETELFGSERATNEQHSTS